VTTRSAPVRLGTRGSALALVQTGMVRHALAQHHPGITVAIERISTYGDRVLDRPLMALGERGVFVAEIEAALREGRIDLAVHSAKDLPSTLPDDMEIAAYLPRADVRDVLVSAAGSLERLPAGARIGTSSPRRVCQLLALRPDVAPVDIRGNVDTRLRKLAAGEFDAVILAQAGLERLGLMDSNGALAIVPFATTDMLPAPGQGALAIEIRADRPDIIALLAPLNDRTTATAVTAERAFLAAVGGGCSAVAAALTAISGEMLELSAMIGAVDGRQRRGRISGTRRDGLALARVLANQLLADGGRELLRDGGAVAP
jgi:hydroxymethylbilane synthase